MTDRDRLIEIVLGIPNALITDEAAKIATDYLIANGVTVGDANNATTTWRPASEPPKEEGMYLCINEDGNYFEAYYSQIYEEFGIDSAIYDPQTLGFLDTEWQGYSVTHWMPLPHPPKEVE